MMKLILIACFAAVAHGQTLGFGGCPTVAPLDSLDTGKFAGKWYTQQKYFIMNEIGKCIKVDLLDVFGLAFIVTNSISDSTTSVKTTNMGVSIALGANRAQQVLMYPAAQPPVPTPYNVIATDYTTYAVEYYCADVGFIHFKFAWLLTRAKIPDAGVLNTARAVFDAKSIDKTPLQTVDQTTCPADH